MLDQPKILKSSELHTKLGPMMAIADEDALYLLEFLEQKGLESVLLDLQKQTKSVIAQGITDPMRSIEQELSEYFNGSLSEFKTPHRPLGSAFQQSVWEELKKIPYGETRSYAEISAAIKKPTAFRAVANANGANKIAIVIPCHRVINSNGELGGYAGGISRKKWLIDHEQRVKS